MMSLLLQREELLGAAVVRLDDVYRRLYGDRPDGETTETEHLFKNEVWRQEILQHIVIGSSLILADAVMLTEQNHQFPFIEMIGRAQQYVRDIAKEKNQKEDAVIVVPKILLLYADPETVRRRADTDRGNRGLSPIGSLSSAKNAYSQFEFPKIYEPLYLNTSIETTEAEEERVLKAISFIRGEYALGPTNEDRKREAVESYEHIIKELASL
ncbi:hypothetical protein EXS56_00515 [Candidatus Kaiserbacteria bacterium]|nr:hypothetical protein [Candidatus Kaiserbacteria bacterium]